MQAGRQAGICVNMQVEGMASFYKVNKSIADIRLNFNGFVLNLTQLETCIPH